MRIMQEKLFFKNSKGDRLAALISNPTQSKDKLIVIFAHGLASGKYNRTKPRFEKMLKIISDFIIFGSLS